MINAIISAMSRKSEYYTIYNVGKERELSVYGKNTVAKFLRENGCKFDDKKINLVQGEMAVVFKNKNGNAFIVEETANE